MLEIKHLTPGRFGEPLLEVRMTRGVSSYPGVFKWVLAFAALCLTVSGIFAALGAAPVLGFAGLELILLFVLLRVSFRRAASEEGLSVSGDDTIVQRAGPNGRHIVARLQSYWLQIEPARYGAQGIVLRSRGTKIAVGVGLPANELHDLTAAVRGALHKVKNESTGT